MDGRNVAGLEAASWEVPGGFTIRGNIQPAWKALLIACANEGSRESQTMSNPELEAPFIPLSTFQLDGRWGRRGSQPPAETRGDSGRSSRWFRAWSLNWMDILTPSSFIPLFM